MRIQGAFFVSEWFHAEGNRQLGPVSREEIQALHAAGRINLQTLVWRDGMAHWQPLSSVAGEFDLVAPPLPPPLIDSAAPVPPLPAAPPVAAPPPPPPPMQPAVAMPKKGLSGCAIFAIIGGALLLVLVPIGAILAAIALPAYNDYVIRAKVTEAANAVQMLKPQVETFATAEGRCPTSADPGFPERDGLRAQGVSSLQLGRFDSGNCGIEATLEVGKPAVDGDLLWLEYDADAAHWACSGESADKYLPADCKG